MRLEVRIDKLTSGVWSVAVVSMARADLSTRVFAPDIVTLTNLTGQCVAAHIEMWATGKLRG